MRTKASFAMLFAVALVVGLLFSGVFTVPVSDLAARETGAKSPEELAELRDFAGKLETLFETAAEAVSPAVVSVRAVRKYRVRVRDPLEEFFRPPFLDDRFFGRPRPQRERELERQVLGSGVILDQEGHILTNNHVVAEATELQVRLADGRSFDAELTGRDEKTELAVIRIVGEPENLPTAELGDSDHIHIGQWVLAIGHPFELRHTVSAGIVSATGRTGFRRVAEYEDWIQTDAAINPGNSGGPLVDLRGEVIGINTFIVSQAGGNLGIGFAIPINMAKDILDDLIAGREVVRGYLGVYVGDLTVEMAEGFGFEGTDGALVHEVTADSPAAEAGIEPGDVIIQYDAERIANANGLRRRAAATEPGARVEVKVWREGKEVTVKLRVGDLATAIETAEDWLGLHVQTLTEEMAQNMGKTGLRGVLVADVEEDSPAVRYITAGDVILSVNRKPVASVDEYRGLMARARPAGRVLLRVLDAESGRTHFLLLTGKRRPRQ